jgi:hypothetical protein
VLGEYTSYPGPLLLSPGRHILAQASIRARPASGRPGRPLSPSGRHQARLLGRRLLAPGWAGFPPPRWAFSQLPGWAGMWTRLALGPAPGWAALFISRLGRQLASALAGPGPARPLGRDERPPAGPDSPAGRLFLQHPGRAILPSPAGPACPGRDS